MLFPCSWFNLLLCFISGIGSLLRFVLSTKMVHSAILCYPRRWFTRAPCVIGSLGSLLNTVLSSLSDRSLFLRYHIYGLFNTSVRGFDNVDMAHVRDRVRKRRLLLIVVLVRHIPPMRQKQLHCPPLRPCVQMPKR